MRKLIAVAAIVLAACAPPKPLPYQGPPIRPVPPKPPPHRIVLVYCVVDGGPKTCALFYSDSFTKAYGLDTAEHGPLSDILPGEYLYCTYPATPADCNN